jgi:hypothetical protein
MSKELKEDLTLWTVAAIVALIFGAIAVPADAEEPQSLFLDNSVKVAPPPRPSVETIIVPGEHREIDKDRTRHSHNEKRLKKQLEDRRNANDGNRGPSRDDDDNPSSIN